MPQQELFSSAPGFVDALSWIIRTMTQRTDKNRAKHAKCMLQAKHRPGAEGFIGTLRHRAHLPLPDHPMHAIVRCGVSFAVGDDGANGHDRGSGPEISGPTAACDAAGVASFVEGPASSVLRWDEEALAGGAGGKAVNDMPRAGMETRLIC
jgi:hypothetical protein